MSKVFIDTETTGLNYDLNRVVELSWAIDDGPIKTIIPPHSLDDAHPKALEINQYFARGLDKAPRATPEDIEEFLADVKGNTLVGANPRFDARMLVNSLRLSDEPWHYRLFDLQSFAAGILGTELPIGMAELQRRVVDLGFDIPRPDHTAAGDVEATRACYNALVEVQARIVRESEALKDLVRVSVMAVNRTLG